MDGIPIHMKNEPGKTLDISAEPLDDETLLCRTLLIIDTQIFECLPGQWSLVASFIFVRKGPRSSWRLYDKGTKHPAMRDGMESQAQKWYIEQDVVQQVLTY